MKKLYDEIMGLNHADNLVSDYEEGFEDGIKQAAELAKKYDDEIERLEERIRRQNHLIMNISK